LPCSGGQSPFWGIKDDAAVSDHDLPEAATTGRSE
jgi:hypothetical protein